ncbi:MAG: FtsQ-type POTRA domain-containing protein [Anaerolineae bacterium]|nr:FtsQ-type POTRA domain-containing protein [Anaerolineae bacterium]
MVVSSETGKKRAKRARRVNSSHVAPRGHREAVAQPVVREAPDPSPRRPARRKRPARRESPVRRPPVTEAGAMIQPRSDQMGLLFSARMLSVLILLGLSVVLVLLFQSNAFFVHHIEVGGLTYLTAEEIFALSEVANLHLFWVDPEDVREQVMRSPSVADARVSVTWPPHGVQIEVRERAPALIWEQAGVRTWIDVRGRVMQQRLDIEGLLRVVVEDGKEPLGPNVIIPQGVVDGALQMKALQPDLAEVIYDPVDGLGYQDPRGWRVWFGIGAEMPARMNVYEAIVADLEARDIYPELIDVGDVDAPYYKVWWGREEAGEAVPPAAAVDNQ